LNSGLLQEGAVCGFLHGFRRLERLGSSLQLACLNSYLAAAGQNLTSLNCSAYVLFTADILVLRRSPEFISLIFFNTCERTSWSVALLDHLDGQWEVWL
jgi:hypothetical protein